MSKNNYFSTSNLKQGLGWILLVIGIFLYVIGFVAFPPESNIVWKLIILKLADVLVIGVVLGFVTNAARFLGIFKQDLQDIIYGREFIKHRKDIYPLWENLSKELFKNKFPKIHTSLLTAVNEYLPKNEISYYNDYEAHSTIEWIDQEKGIIQVTDIITFDLISDTDKTIDFPIKTTTTIKNPNDYQSKITQIFVNDLSPNVKHSLKKNEDKIEGDTVTQEYVLTLCGSQKYKIKYTRVKRYNIHDDYFIAFRARYIVNQLRVSLQFPDTIEAQFVCRGTQKDYEYVNKTKNLIETKYQGIILPRQGYIFVLREKK